MGFLNLVPSTIRAHFWLGPLALYTPLFALSALAIGYGILPSHDAIAWQGIFHYYSKSVSQGFLPLWNPYGRTGEAFYPYYQLLGLLQPSYFLAIFGNQFLPSEVAFSLHYYLQVYLFSLGIYLLLRLFLKDNWQALIFSSMAQLSCLPQVSKQNGTILGFCWAPLIIFLFFKTLEDRLSPDKRGPILFSASALIGIALNSYLPSLLALTLFSLFLWALCTKYFWQKAKELHSNSTGNLIWLAASAGVLLLLTAPILALYLELHAAHSDFFPSNRFFQHTANYFPACILSHIQESIFSKFFIGEMRSSMNLSDLAGIFFEPWQRGRLGPPSENVFLIGIFPIVCAGIAILRRVRFSPPFVILFAISFFEANNFRTHSFDKAGPTQIILESLLPFLSISEVSQNFSITCLYSAFILAALGYSALKTKIRTKKGLLLAELLLATSYANIAYVSYRHLIIDGYVNSVYSDFVQKVGSKPAPEPPLSRGDRITFSFRRSDKYFSSIKGDKSWTFYGRDIMSGERSAWPNLMRYTLQADPRPYPDWDQMYASKFYFDYISNIDIEAQAAWSAMNCPRTTLFPVSARVAMADTESTIAAMNSDAKREKIFIAKAFTPTPQQVDAANACLFQNSENRVIPAAKALAFIETLKGACPLKPIGTSTILPSQENNIKISTNSSEASILFLSEAYSKDWRASIDGKPVRIERANINFMSVDLPAGVHEILFEFYPRYFVIALYLYFAGLSIFVLAAVFMFFGLRPRGNNSGA